MAAAGRPLSRTQRPALAPDRAPTGTKAEALEEARGAAKRATLDLRASVGAARDGARERRVAQHEAVARAKTAARRERRDLIKEVKRCPASLGCAPDVFTCDDDFLLEAVSQAKVSSVKRSRGQEIDAHAALLWTISLDDVAPAAPFCDPFRPFGTAV